MRTSAQSQSVRSYYLPLSIIRFVIFGAVSATRHAYEYTLVVVLILSIYATRVDEFVYYRLSMLANPSCNFAERND